MKNLFKSKIVWTNVLSTLVILFQGWGDFGIVDPRLAAAFIFLLTLAFNQWSSFSTIFQTGVDINWALVGTNLVGIALMVGDYFMHNRLFELFGTDAKTAALIVFTLTTVLRSAFVNQQTANAGA